MAKILSIFCFMYISCAFTMDLCEPFSEGESYLDDLVCGMDKGLPADQANNQEYVSYFLIDALPTPPKCAKRLRADELSFDDYPLTPQRTKISASKSPVFDSFVYCAFSKDGAEIIDVKNGKIRITKYDEFLNCIERVCVKKKPAKDTNSRIKSFRKFIVDWPQKSEAILGDFTVSIQKSVQKSMSDLARFRKLVAQYQADKKTEIPGPPHKRRKKSDD